MLGSVIQANAGFPIFSLSLSMSIFSYASIGLGIYLLCLGAVSAWNALRPIRAPNLSPRVPVEGQITRFNFEPGDGDYDYMRFDTYIPVIEYTVNGRRYEIKLRQTQEKPRIGEKHMLAYLPQLPSDAVVMIDPVEERRKNRVFAVAATAIGALLCVGGVKGWIN
jgi:Protein of unknown function (DUF3592)